MAEKIDRMAYPPLNKFKPVAENVWIVDGPMIRFGIPWPKMPFSTRMTIIRIKGSDLFIHSPTPLTDSLRGEIREIGNVRHIIGPNRIHYWWIPEWHTAFPKADVWLAPRIREQAGDRIDFSAPELTTETGYPWDEEIRTLPVEGGFMTEVEFFHPVTSTLILTDLIENFEPHKLTSMFVRWIAWLGGVLDPDGKMPRDLRLTFVRQKPQLKAAIEKMISWNPKRVIIAHGRWYQDNGTYELRRAFRWALA